MFSPVFQCFARRLSSSSSAPDPKIYEFRQYSIRPDSLTKFIQLSKEQFHLRLSHSKLVGYFTVELGDLSKVLHIWEYDSFEHRRRVREELSKDVTWITQYVKPAFPLITGQTNAVLRRIPGYGGGLDPKDDSKSVYLLQSRILKADSEPQVLTRLQKPPDINPSCMLAMWRGVFGSTPSLYSLHKFPTFDVIGPSSLDDIINKTSETLLFLNSHSLSVSNLGLLPTPWSTLQ
ncbi:hypothetical protein LOD99_2751 [Oopsacas minuta]|uniref:NIPSNAP domain-containing protein n=1 Tax=Oopsacas minuta TaxID=111878 RepID=A0AAV7K0X8_9METZ|nr:hypothetical protein LOD99_2751 [Oopsacas minuta]